MSKEVHSPAHTTGELPALLVLTGPTGTGKTGLAIELARRFPIEIVNADASQVYIGMDIGTAKPTKSEFDSAKHHLYSIVPPDSPLNAGSYAEMANRTISAITAVNKIPMLVGGTGLYIRAVTQGLAEIPNAAPEVRVELKARLASGGLAELRRELEDVDPEAARKIDANDQQRTLRSLEVFISTGVPISQYQKDHKFAAKPYDTYQIGLTLPDEELRPKLKVRITEMLKCGFVAEVEYLLSQGYSPELRSFKALGYREVSEYIRGQISYETMIDQIYSQHVQYSRRQKTWFRRVEGLHWHSPYKPGPVVDEVRSFLASRGTMHTF